MFLNLLFSSPSLAVVWVAAIVIALTVHEFAHALVGKWRGDDTAEREGRLTLNPLAHLDPFGFVLLLVAGFGWAKPVPFDPRALPHPVKDGLLIALAGPLANLVLAVLSALAFRAFVASGIVATSSLLSAFLILAVLVNLLLLFFNLVPVHPLDGSKITDALFSAPRYRHIQETLERYGPRVLFFLVLVSLFTNVNVFFFVQIPSFLLCEGLLDGACLSGLEYFFGAS